ncbi:MAG TPA: hypothetical protein VI583_12185 [Cyclobacteriaceae bacterium]|nr:hypothetical protein [Cyclobacteriaceae bacterium]
MELKLASNTVIGQLKNVLDQIKQEDYIKIIPSHNATVGQHARHIIEFYSCLFGGIETQTVNYDNRMRDHDIETDIRTAKSRIGEIITRIRNFHEDPLLDLEVSYNSAGAPKTVIKTSYSRELVYNIEHTIHHLAIIKSALQQYFPYISLPENFGVANSTIRYRDQLTH